MDKKTIDFLSTTFLFSDVDKEVIRSNVKESDVRIEDYAAKEWIFTPSSYSEMVGFVIRGECTVERLKADGAAVPLNVLGCGDSFGIMAILSASKEFPTRIVAKGKTKILFITKTAVIRLIETIPSVSMNVIRFLSKKIEFLNQKIATFSSDSVEEKFLAYLLEQTKGMDEPITFNAKKSAEAINAGRASLYRAISSLTNSGFIKVENKKIYIIDRKGLERNKK